MATDLMIKTPVGSLHCWSVYAIVSTTEMLRHLCRLTMHAFVSSCVRLKLKCEFLSVGPKHTGPAVTQKELDPKGKTPFHGETEQEKV
jgi:hypothetical protein